MAKKKCKAHHYMLETPNGKTAEGVCKFCGHTKTHYNNNDPSFSNMKRKRIVKKGRKPQDVVGIRLRGGHFANGFENNG